MHSGTFELLSEVAIAVAGFAGVASAFGGRDRSFGPIDLLRLTALFQYSGVVLGGCFALFTFEATGLGPSISFGVVSLAAAILYGLLAFSTLPRAYRLATSEETSTSPGRIYFIAATHFIFVPILTFNAVVLSREWPIIVVFSSSLLIALWLFHGLLTRKG